jgi:hypothetical protein
VAGTRSAAVHPCDMGASAPQCVAKGRIQCSDTWSGESFRSVSQSAAKEGQPSHCHVRLPKIVSVPIADVLEGGSQRPILCHIVTGLRHLLFRVASMRVSQASVAEMLQRLLAGGQMSSIRKRFRSAASDVGAGA